MCERGSHLSWSFRGCHSCILSPCRYTYILQVANDKIVKLSDHIEKLVLHLKHESAGKTKALRKLAKEIDSKKAKVASLQKKNAIKVHFLQTHSQSHTRDHLRA